MSSPDYYEILGIDPDATAEEIRASYRRLAKLYHPDTAPADREKFKLITAAYDVISDPAKRAEYDRIRASEDASEEHEATATPQPKPARIDFGHMRPGESNGPIRVRICSTGGWPLGEAGPSRSSGEFWRISGSGMSDPDDPDFDDEELYYLLLDAEVADDAAPGTYTDVLTFRWNKQEGSLLIRVTVVEAPRPYDEGGASPGSSSAKGLTATSTAPITTSHPGILVAAGFMILLAVIIPILATHDWHGPTRPPTTPSTLPEVASTAFDITPVFSSHVVLPVREQNTLYDNISVTVDSMESANSTLSIGFIYDDGSHTGTAEIPADWEQSCLRVENNGNEYTLNPTSQNLTPAASGQISGTLAFPELLPGDYYFDWPCLENDDPDEIGSVSGIPLLGVLEGTESDFIAVYEVRTSQTQTVILYGMDAEGVDLNTSCISMSNGGEDQGSSYHPTAVTSTSSASTVITPNFGPFRAGIAGTGVATFALGGKSPGFHSAEYRYPCDFSDVNWEFAHLRLGA